MSTILMINERNDPGYSSALQAKIALYVKQVHIRTPGNDLGEIVSDGGSCGGACGGGFDGDSADTGGSCGGACGGGY